MLGNIPPRDVLANGTEEQIRNEVKSMLTQPGKRSRIIASCGGGMPPDVTSENIQVFLEAVKKFS